MSSLITLYYKQFLHKKFVNTLISLKIFIITWVYTQNNNIYFRWLARVSQGLFLSKTHCLVSDREREVRNTLSGAWETVTLPALPLRHSYSWYVFQCHGWKFVTLFGVTVIVTWQSLRRLLHKNCIHGQQTEKSGVNTCNSTVSDALRKMSPPYVAARKVSS